MKYNDNYLNLFQAVFENISRISVLKEKIEYHCCFKHLQKISITITLPIYMLIAHVLLRLFSSYTSYH